MKKLVPIVVLLILLTVGCNKKHRVFHTYYGDFDLDTMTAIADRDGAHYYLVKTEVLDSVTVKALGCEKAMIAYFYKPSTNVYFNVLYDNDGRSGLRTYFDPYTDSVWCTEIFSPYDSTVYCMEDFIDLKKDSLL